MRHGEATHNVGFTEDGLQAYKDPIYRNSLLTKTGIDQCRRANLPNIDVAYSSPLNRCIQTAFIAKLNSIPIILRDELIEQLDEGYLCNERDSKETIASKYSFVDTEMLHNTIPKMSKQEPEKIVKIRMQLFLRELCEKYKSTNKKILIVSHHDTLLIYLGIKFKNAQVVKITHDDLVEHIILS
jgi:broad specificity phosphatase PhoE